LTTSHYLPENAEQGSCPGVFALDRLSADLGKVPLTAFPDRFEAYMKLFQEYPFGKVQEYRKEGKASKQRDGKRIIECVRAAFNSCHCPWIA